MINASYIYALMDPGQWQKKEAEERGKSEADEDSGEREADEDGGEREADEDSAIAVMKAKVSSGQNAEMKTVKLLPGERLGWWLKHRFDQRTRMRAEVMGAVNDRRTRILLDTGANVSAISAKLAKRLKLRRLPSDVRQMSVQGIGESKIGSAEKVMIKVTLGWQLAYEVEVWVIPHFAGVDLILGTDFMIPAGVRLNLFNATARMPDEMVVPLVRSQHPDEQPNYSSTIGGGPDEALSVGPRQTETYKLPRDATLQDTHELWLRRTEPLIPTLVHSKSGRPTKIRLTNVTLNHVWCPAHFPFAEWVLRGDLPRSEGYVRSSSAKYRDWQVQAYESAIDRRLLAKEQVLYDEWLARQPPAVDRPAYAIPTEVLKRELSAAELRGQRLPTCEERWEKQMAAAAEQELQSLSGEAAPARSSDSTNGLMGETSEGEWKPPPGLRVCQSGGGDEHDEDSAPSTGEDDSSNCPEADETFDDLDNVTIGFGDPVDELDKCYIALAEAEIAPRADLADTITVELSFEHPGNDVECDDYAHELAYLPDLVNEVPTVQDYSSANVTNPELSSSDQAKLVRLLKKHETIMISSGNALPPPAFGAICDIDVGDHPPIRQRARRVPMKYLKKLYELLKGLLSAGLIAFSSSPWASPIVIVPKKNGLDIRLCIDYKRLNEVTVLMEYAMPLVDDMLTDLDAYLWFCSLDAASGFWAVMMTMRARLVSAFVCALGHFEWLRMPFGLKNAPMIYQRLIDNALWGYIKPRGGWEAFAGLMRKVEAASTALRVERRKQALADESFGGELTKFEGDKFASTEEDPLVRLINSPLSDMFTTGEPDDSPLTPVFDRRSFVDDICFGGETFDDCLHTLDRLLQRFTQCRISVSFTKSIFAQKAVDFLGHRISAAGVAADPKKLQTIQALPFPKTKKGVQSFLGALNYYGRFIQDLASYGAVLYQLKDDDFSSGGDLTKAESAFTALKSRVAAAPILRHFDHSKEVHVMLYANEWAMSSTLMQYHDEKLHPVRFCSRVLKDAERNYYPAEKEVLALLNLLKTCYTLLAGKPIHVYTRFSTLEWVFQSKSLFGRAVKFAVLLSPWHLKVTRVKERDATFCQLLQASITPSVTLDELLAPFAPPSKGSAELRVAPHLLYACLPRDYAGYVVSFDGSAKTEKLGGYGSCSSIWWRLPAWDIVIAATTHLASATVNTAEYTGMNNGVLAALSAGVTDLIIVGDSRLAIQQSMGVIACKKESLLQLLTTHKTLTRKLNSVKYLHVVREYNAAADSLASETLETQTSKVVLNSNRKSELRALNRIQEVIYADEEPKTDEENPDENDGNPPADMAKHEPLAGEQSRMIPDAEKRAYVTVMTRSGAKRSRMATEAPRQKRKEQTRVTAEEPQQANTPLDGIDKEYQPKADERNSASDPCEVQAERRLRIANAQDEEEKWSHLKAYLRNELDKLNSLQASRAAKVADDYILDEEGVLYRLGRGRPGNGSAEVEVNLRLVVPTTLIDEVLHHCHDSMEGAHQGIVRTYTRVKRDYYWTGLYADVVRYVQTCIDCNTSKSKPQLRGYSPGNVIASRPFQLVSMDFVIPLPRTHRGNTALLLFQDHFTGFVIAKPMADTSAIAVAQVFEECIYRRFGAPTLLRHDRDPRFMSDVFQAFARMMQAKSRATMSYRPQANGQQERSVKTVVQTIRTYVESPLQDDWDDIAERVVQAINSSVDATRQETPFYLVHGWDAQTTLKAMTAPLRRGNKADEEAAEWRRLVLRQQEIAWKLAKAYQQEHKARRARKHNASLSRKERATLEQTDEGIDRAESSGDEKKPDEPTPDLTRDQAVMAAIGGITHASENLRAATPEDTALADKKAASTSPLRPGCRVWLFMERVRPGLKKKLAHRWHGPLRIKERVADYAYKLELPDEVGYRFYPVVHVSRLNPVSEQAERPQTKLIKGLVDADRFDFDEELLPEDSWEADEEDGSYEVEAILDDDQPLSTDTARHTRLFLVKWKGYPEATWEPLSHLNCGGLLFDYLLRKKHRNRLRMVQTADEDDEDVE